MYQALFSLPLKKGPGYEARHTDTTEPSVTFESSVGQREGKCSVMADTNYEINYDKFEWREV